jgi:signal transduction histidine kinase
VSEVLSVYTFLAEQKKISMENHLSGGMTICGDKEHLKIIFQNIIGNAIKFTNPGGTIRLFHTMDNYTVTLHVKDDGVGIPAAKLATLFDSPGPSLSTFGTASEKGTGIGLQLVRQFVEHNDGRISITSTVDKGTETCISFACISRPIKKNPG